MRKKLLNICALIVLFISVICMARSRAYAADRTDKLSGSVYDFGDKDDYNLNKAVQTQDSAIRFFINGNVNAVSSKDGFVSYDVKSGNLKVFIDTFYGKEIYQETDKKQWHIITDKNKKVDSTTLSSVIGSGAIIVQTSKDGKIWINADSVTDIFSNYSELNKREINGETKDSFYETTNLQIANGCYYRIIVAYRLQREIEPTKVLFATITNTEEKERVEIYQFHAFSSEVAQKEDLRNAKNKYEFSDVYRVDSTEGFKNPKRIESSDPHVDWTVGKFYVSGYTSVQKDGDIPVFLKVPGDKTALWFNLEHELDKCNGRTDVKVDYIDSGSDIYFGTPNIKNIGRGMLIIRKTDNLNQKERQIYTNYLEASATVGANTRIDLFEEGDYEVALDYRLHYDKPFVFGTTTTKTLSYRVFFQFKVRNGDISGFIRDIKTGQFIQNANVAEQGFYIDVANSKYLQMSIKREVLTEGLDGLVEDTQFTGVAQEGRWYTDEGVYTVTIVNPALENSTTGGVLKKTVYVGNRDIMRAHMATGISLSEIKGRLDEGAYIDENGQIIDPEPEEETVEESTAEESATDESSESEETVMIEENSNAEETYASDSVDEIKEEGVPKHQEERNQKLPIAVIVVIVIAIIFLLTGGGAAFLFVKKQSEKGDDESEENS